MGCTESDIQQWIERQNLGQPTQEIWPINLPSVLLFFACSNAWNFILLPNGTRLRTGLRWSDVEARARRMPKLRALADDDNDRVWADLNIMESEVLTAQSER